MKKLVIIAVIVILAVIGGFMLMHKSSKPISGSSGSSSQASGPAVNNAVLITKTSSSVGSYLADPSGKTLYTYGADSNGVSNCTGSCLANWPPYLDKGATTNLPSGVGTITRKDNGQIQFTYNGMPLYYFSGDSAGQVTGDGVNNFNVAKPAAASSQSSSPAPAQSSSPSTSSQPAPSSSSGSPY